MVTLILPAYDLPDYCKCRKPTGQKPYTLRQRLPVYGLEQEITVDPSIVFIVSDSGVNAVPNDTKLAVDLDYDEAIAFLQQIREENRAHQ